MVAGGWAGARGRGERGDKKRDKRALAAAPLAPPNRRHPRPHPPHPLLSLRASDKCQREKRKTINGDDLLWALSTLGFECYVDPLKAYLAKYRDAEKASAAGGRGGGGGGDGEEGDE